MFILGFSVVFILLGNSTTIVGCIFYDYSIWMARIGGAILIVFSIQLIGLLKIPILERQLRFNMKNKPTSQVRFFCSWNEFWSRLDPLYWSNFGWYTNNCSNKRFDMDRYSAFGILCIDTCYTFFYFSFDNRKIHHFFQKNQKMVTMD